MEADPETASRDPHPESICPVCDQPMKPGETAGNVLGEPAHFDCYVEWKDGRKTLSRVERPDGNLEEPRPTS